ncbi:GTP-Rho binding exocyst subunit [Microsporum canis]
MSSRDRSRGHPTGASPRQDRRGGGEMRNGSGPMNPPSGSSRAEKFEDEKRRIIQSCFSKKDSDGSTLESYITHIRITEDAAYPSAPPPTTSPPENKKPRAIIVSVRKSGRVRMHKSRENSDGSFSIGKTWTLDDLSRIQIYDHLTPSSQIEQQQKSWAADLGFIVTITKPYYWTAATSKERDFFIGSLVKIYKKYTGGKVPDLVGLEPREKEALVGSLPLSSQPPPQSQSQSQSQPPPQPQTRGQDPRLMLGKDPRSRSPSTGPNRSQSPYSSLPPSRDGPPEARKQPSREQFLQSKPSQDQMPRAPPPTSLLPRIPGDNSSNPLSRPPPQTPPVEQLSKKFTEAPSTENLVPSPVTSEHPQILPNRTYKPMPLSPVSDGGLLPNKTYTPMPAPALSPKSEDRPQAYGQSKQQPSPDSGDISPFSKPVRTRPSTSESSLPASLRPAFDRSPSYDQKSVRSVRSNDGDNGDDDRHKGPPPSREPPKVEFPPVARDISQPDPPKVRPPSINGEIDSALEKEVTEQVAPEPPSEPLLKTESSPEQSKLPVLSTPPAVASSISLPEPEPQPGPEPTPEAETHRPETHRPGLGPMMKSKGGAKDVANVLRKAANAYNAFKPRAGGAGERLLAAKEKEKPEGPDGITSVVPAPLLRGISAENAAKPSSTEPPKVQVTDSSTGKEVSFDKPSEPLAPKKKKMKQPDEQPREDNAKKSCSALGIDSAVLGGRGVEFDWLLTDLGWDGRLAKDKGIEALEADIRREIGRVQASSWLSQIQSSHDGRVDQLAKLFDRAMEECDELDGLLTLYSHELDTLSEDVHYIESQGQGLQTRLANQRLLQSELQARIKSKSGSR